MNEGEARSDLRAAVRLFNAGSYLAAHEVLDELWESTSGPDEGFYKGLIQAAVGMHHLQEGNLEGALKLLRGQRRLLAPYLPRHRGLAVDALLEELSSVAREAAGEGAARVRPQMELAEEG